MKTIIGFWLRFGYVVYWLGWLGSMSIWNVSTWIGIGIGLIVLIVWFAILNIFSIINGDGWVWEW